MCSDPDLVQEAPGVRIHNVIPMIPKEQIFARDGSNGINVRYFNDGSDKPIIDEIHPHPQAMMFGRLREGIKAEGFHYEISTTLIPKTTGLHTIGARTTGSCVVKVNGKEVCLATTLKQTETNPLIRLPQKTMTGIEVEDFLFRPQNLQVLAQVQMTAGTPYFIDLIVQPHKPAAVTGEPIIHSAMLCYMESYSNAADIAAAVQVASTADVTLIFAGRTPEHESEGFDAADISLPANQVQMIKAVAAASRRSVVILSCGNPIDVQDFVEDVDAVVNAHFLGQEGAAALAEVLFGEVCPSGKLAVSWPKRMADAPSSSFYPARETESGWEMSCGEGVGMGYRHAWKKSALQWPFGFGLSYTTFEISSLAVKRVITSGAAEEGEVVVEVVVANTGNVDGAEVVQVYVEDVVSSVSRPSKELKGFAKVVVQSQSSETVSITLKDKYAFSFWDEGSKKWTVEAGEFKIHVGECVASVQLDTGFSWSGL